MNSSRQMVVRVSRFVVEEFEGLADLIRGGFEDRVHPDPTKDQENGKNAEREAEVTELGDHNVPEADQ